MVRVEKAEDLQSQQDSSSRDYKCLYKIIQFALFFQ